MERTPVAIVGAGPAGLMLSHLLSRAGVDSVAIDLRTRAEIEATHRAGILEHVSVRLLVDEGVSDRVLREGDEHEGIALRFGGRSHRLDFRELAGSSVWLYPQTEVFVDLADARRRDGGDVRFGVRDVQVDVTGERPLLRFTDADGTPVHLTADLLVGADGSRSVCRHLVPEADRRRYTREYPFAWFGILCQAPRSHDELVYTRSERGFALISSRTETLQRMYFQCDPATDPHAWSDDRIWAELQARVAGEDSFTLREGPITERAVLPFRSFVQEPLHHGRLALAGDAGHTVPPTGAKGLNLALQDVRVLAEVVPDVLRRDDPSLLAHYSQRALQRVWRAQHFSYWMTSMLHNAPDGSPFDDRRALGELTGLTRSAAGSCYLAEGYTGWPS
ncbi:4-hydroxybenzoate 3-monooxygenase [Calidifontibacter sp. DB0510]|uniref:4-hydroxybenzoate 3-monooxygenase n=1 Tax=Metallococcus carri TaxID=1656884 RepID=A0A967B1F2_9MICO|nr:4-hydroxybenzoate 3-monooxygenase [Metallococcus carri]NHN56272.1 4-hydroxybenzoate 3-monooxygenase [Metallococcus carri]NOP38676.1 4-hydroxybenzoate 3-monooxygenase [Calidifontibacter sp. DB2511S]